MKKWIVCFILAIAFTLPVTAFAEEARYDFDCQGTKLKDTIYSIALRAGKDVTINEKLDGTVLTSMKNKTVTEALDILSKAFTFNWMIDNDVIVVTPADTMLQNKLFTVKYASLDQIKKELVSLNIPEKNISVNPEYNTVSVAGTSYFLQTAEKRIQELDKPIDQILISAQMIAVTRNDALKVGFQYTLPGYDNSTTPFRAQYTVTSNANQTFDKGTVLDRPSIVTHNGSKAELLMGSQVPVFSSSTTNGTTDTSITFKDVGDKLSVTPVLNDKGEKIITLNLECEVSSLEKWVTSGDETAPQISTRRAKTVARVKSGESLIIGGLMTAADIENISGIPGLMKLPLVGKFFQFKNKTKDKAEIFIVVTPYLLEGNSDAEAMKKIMLEKESLNQGANKKTDTASKEALPPGPLPATPVPVPEPPAVTMAPSIPNTI